MFQARILQCISFNCCQRRNGLTATVLKNFLFQSANRILGVLAQLSYLHPHYALGVKCARKSLLRTDSIVKKGDRGFIKAMFIYI